MLYEHIYNNTLIFDPVLMHHITAGMWCGRKNISSHHSLFEICQILLHTLNISYMHIHRSILF